MRTHLLVIAKEPVPGRVKTRLCPPCTPWQAARVAAAALADTLDAVRATPAAARTAVLDGSVPVPAGLSVVGQRGAGLAQRLQHAFGDTLRPDTASLLIGMDTPQVTRELLTAVCVALWRPGVDAVLGPAQDGGWWALGLRDPRHGDLVRDVPMSTGATGAYTYDALRRRGLTVAALPRLRDVDTAFDAYAVARLCRPDSRFAAAVAAHVPLVVSR
jgi:glycosyltransferase A (GT-A) superfamily protein (DUF2064 family)